jgi:hypothetical protein
MNTPVIRLIHSEEVPAALRIAEGEQVYVVVQPGVFAGRAWAQGEHIVCRAATGPKVDGPLLLAPVGKGGPMLGMRRQWRIYGVHGEPCSALRWRVAGELVGVWARRGRKWTEIDHLFVQSGVARAVPGERRQLGLFATAA